ncbi:uncharacterized protein LOC134202652 [Armigeres subalbatus]|uniref:uncharacterized protein LOC134202652 n=1 Tax=Armigeres subalbatus TaxID=124917 RepID=UPI002ED5E63C
MILNFYEHEEFYKELGNQFKELDLSEYWSFIHDYKNAFESSSNRHQRVARKHVSLGDFYIHWLRCMMMVKQQATNNLAKSLAASLQTRLQQLKQNSVFKAALLTDPRFNYISSSVLSPDEKEETRKFIVATSERIKSFDNTQPQRANNADDKNTSTSNLDDFMTSLFGGSLPATSQSTIENIFEKQINALDLETHQNYKYNTWKHWLGRKETHPELSAVALAIMAVPATQVSVERAFSALALVLSPARTKLSAQNLESILLIKLNEGLLSTTIANLYDWKDFKGLSALVEG